MSVRLLNCLSTRSSVTCCSIVGSLYLRRNTAFLPSKTSPMENVRGARSLASTHASYSSPPRSGRRLASTFRPCASCRSATSRCLTPVQCMASSVWTTLVLGEHRATRARLPLEERVRLQRPCQSHSFMTMTGCPCLVSPPAGTAVVLRRDVLEKE